LKSASSKFVSSDGILLRAFTEVTWHVERSKTALVNASLAGKATDNGSLRDLKTIFGFDGNDSDEDEE
jgi:hypothetical protein